MPENDRSIEILQFLKQFCKDHEKKKLPKIAQIAEHFSMSEYEVGKWLRVLISLGFLTLNYNHWGFSKEIWDEITAPKIVPPAEVKPVIVEIPEVTPVKPAENNFIAFVEAVLHNQKLSQYVIFVIALAISCFLVGKMGLAISANIATAIVCLIIFVFIELVGQFCLGRGKYYRKTKSKLQWVYFIVFGVYVILFSIPASVGFFTSEMAVQSTAITATGGRLCRAGEQVSEISNSLVFQYALLAKETNTGYGPRVEAIMGNINELKADQKAAGAVLDAEAAAPQRAERNVYFALLSKAFWGLPEALIKVVMFAVAMVLLQFAIIITCPVFGKDKE